MKKHETKIISASAPPTTFDLVSITRSGEDRILVLIYSGLTKTIEQEYTYEASIQFLNKRKINDTVSCQFIAISGATLFSRAAILGGAFRKDVFNAYDRFAKKIQKLVSTKEIMKETINLALEYGKMVENSKIKCISTPIVYRATDYVHTHIKEKIKCDQVAKYVHCSEQYLGKLFKKELGNTISNYIMKEKINHSLMMVSDFTIPFDTIWKQYSFCSKSHYIQSFKKIIGITPHKYRDNLTTGANKNKEPLR